MTSPSGSPEVPYGDPTVPEVPYGDALGDVVPGPAPPRWLRRWIDEPQPPDQPVGTLVLEEPPRSVPLAYRLSAASLSGWGMFALVLVVLAPMALWLTVPWARTTALLVGVPVLLALRWRRYARRIGILRWGRVATVTQSASHTTASTFTNWPMRQARGWDVTASLYSGQGTATDVTYAAEGRTGTLTLRGLPYVDGVVLADSRHPERAMVVSQFPHSVKPGLDGRYRGWLAPARWLWVTLSVAATAGLLALLVWTVLDLF